MNDLGTLRRQQQALAQAYTEAHPSRQPSIRWFGHRLVDFMASRVDQHDGLVPHPAMVDMARLDWALRDAFEATEAQVLDASALAEVASGRPFARWCELAGTLLDDPHAAVPLVVGRLQQWLAEGLLSGVR